MPINSFDGMPRRCPFDCVRAASTERATPILDRVAMLVAFCGERKSCGPSRC